MVHEVEKTAQISRGNISHYYDRVLAWVVLKLCLISLSKMISITARPIWFSFTERNLIGNYFGGLYLNIGKRP